MAWVVKPEKALPREILLMLPQTSHGIERKTDADPLVIPLTEKGGCNALAVEKNKY